MNRTQAIELIRSTFEAPFESGQYIRKETSIERARTMQRSVVAWLTLPSKTRAMAASAR